MKNLLKDQQGMTGLETAIILIAFVTVAAVFGYAVLSAGLFSAERGKETIYAGLNEAKSNLELSGSVMAKSDDNVNVRSVLFTVKNAIAGNPIDMTPNDGSGHNKCVISLKTNSDYINNVKWSFAPIGADNGNKLLETGEQFEITVDLADLGSAGSLSENLTANQTFTLQVKPSLGSSITIQRQLPPAIGPIMDLDLMTSFGGGHSASDNSSGGGGGSSAASLELGPGMVIVAFYSAGTIDEIVFFLENISANPIDMTSNHMDTLGQNTTVISLNVNGNTSNNVQWWGVVNPLDPGGLCAVSVPVTLQTNDTITVSVTPQGGPTFSFSRTIPSVPPTGNGEMSFP